MLENPRAERRSMRMDGYKVRYWFYDVDTTRKPLVVMVHGFRGDHHGLQLIADALRDRYHVVIPDLPGFGRSEAFPADQGERSLHNVANYVAFLREFIERLTDGAIHPDADHGIALLGHSFGSVVAAHLAADYPAMVQRLILVNPISEPALAGDRVLASQVADTYYSLSRKLPFGLGDRLLRSDMVADIMSREMTTTEDPELREYIVNQHRAYFNSYAERRVITEAYLSSTSRTVAEVAPLLKMPVLLITGGKDPMGSPRSQRRMANWITRRREEAFPEVGHLIHYEKAYETAHLVDEFLTGPAPDPVEIHEELPSLDTAKPNTSQLTQLLPVVKRRRDG
ncbi:alpha/beta hydrolase [Kocuria coralli]|uniref:Alpha/beta hydrolase n=1 Tax=Kocuria coralli TaxID=1461025 RepID=A0A5J5L1W0_9MICC|nr:alpha/beta hydrolase [Kocuria coralli]KAA9395076.1 alpha/beta hydrolase [Kocuria coralli]